MSITREDLQAALDGKIPNRFNVIDFSCEVTAIGKQHVLYTVVNRPDSGEFVEPIDHVLKLWSLPVVEQPAPVLEWTWDMYEYRVLDGEFQMLGTGGGWNRVAMFPAQHLAKAYASKYAECAEKAALIEKYRAVRVSLVRCAATMGGVDAYADRLDGDRRYIAALIIRRLAEVENV